MGLGIILLRHHEGKINQMTYHLSKHGFWFRFKSGRGMSVVINRLRLFSERNGYIKVYRFGPIAVQFFGVTK